MKRPLITATSDPRIKGKGTHHQVGYSEFVQQLLEAAKERPSIQLSQRMTENREPNARYQSLDLTEHISEQHSATAFRAYSKTYIETKDKETTLPEPRRKAVDKSQDEVHYTIDDAAGHVNEAFSTLKPRLPFPVYDGSQKMNATSETTQEVEHTPSPDATEEKSEPNAAGPSSVAALIQLNLESTGNCNTVGQKSRRDTIQGTPPPIVIQEKGEALVEAQAEHLTTTRSSVAALLQSSLDKREKERTAPHRTMGQSGDDDQTMAESSDEVAGGGTCQGAEPKEIKRDSFPRACRGASPDTSMPETCTTTSPVAALQRAAPKRSTPGETALQEKVVDERTSKATPTKSRSRKKRQFAQAFGIFKTPTHGHLVSSDIDSSDAEDGHDVHSGINPSGRVPQLPLQPTPELRRKRRDKDQSDSQDDVVYTRPQYSEWTVAGTGLAATGMLQLSPLLEHKSIDAIREEAEAKRSELVSRADIMASAESAVAHYARPWSTTERKRGAKGLIAEGTRRSKRRRHNGGEGEVSLVGTGRIVVAVLIDDKVDLSGHKRADRQGQEIDGAF